MDFATMDSAKLLGTDTFIEIFDIDDIIDRTNAIVQARLRAKSLNVTQGFDKLVKAFEAERKRIDKENAQLAKASTKTGEIANQTNFGGDYPDMHCGGWIADKDGVKAVYDNYVAIACYCPILPVQTLRNVVTGKVKTTLAYKMHNKWEQITVDKGVVSSNSKIVALADYGIPVTTETAKYLVKFLADVEHLNITSIPLGLSTSKMGWHMEQFFPYTDNLIFDGGMEFKDAYEALTPQGDYELWLNAVKGVRQTNRIEPLFIMAASFASPLLKWLGVQTFVANLWGETEGGKTVTSKLAASIWANPASGKYLGDFQATETWIEIKQDFLNNLPLILDDSATVKDKAFFDMAQFVYNRCKEKGKGRSNKSLGIREETTWRQVIIMNGEQPVIFENMQGGAINRTLDLNCGLTKIFDKPRELCDTIDSNYGFAGKKFIEAIQQLGKDKVKEIFDKQLQRVSELDKMDKQSASLACVLTADQIATDYIFKDGIYIDLVSASDVLCDRSFVSENERCYRFITEQATVHNDKFVPTVDKDGNKVYRNECWGRYDDSDNTLSVIRSEFAKLCKLGGFSDKKFLDWAKKCDKIVCSSKGEPSISQRVIPNKKTPDRCVVLKLESIADADVVDDNELPF